MGPRRITSSAWMSRSFSIEGHDVPGHDLAAAQCFDVHAQRGKAGVVPNAALRILGRLESFARSARVPRAKLAAGLASTANWSVDQAFKFVGQPHVRFLVITSPKKGVAFVRRASLLRARTKREYSVVVPGARDHEWLEIKPRYRTAAHRNFRRSTSHFTPADRSQPGATVVEELASAGGVHRVFGILAIRGEPSSRRTEHRLLRPIPISG